MMHRDDGLFPKRLVLNVDRDLLRKLDAVANKVPTSRSELIRNVLRASVAGPDPLEQ